MSQRYFLQKARERVARNRKNLVLWYAAHTVAAALFVIAFVRI